MYPSRAIVLALVGVLATFSVGLAQPRGTAPRPSAAGRPFTVTVLIGSTGAADAPIVDAALVGIALAAKKGRIAHAMRLAHQPKDYASVLDDLAKGSVDLVVAAGTFSLEALSAAAAQHPATRILLVDAALSGAPTVKSVTFRPEEGAFLAGVVAALESRRGRVGFVGGEESTGMPIECGWETGVRWATKERYLAVWGRAIYIGTTPDALVNPAAAEELSRGLIAEQGVDVLYSAAGASGHGVISAARDEKVKVIGVDVDQRELAPNAVITSVRKRVDRAVETAIAEVRRGVFEGGVTVMNLANGGVDLVLPGRLAAPTVKLVEKARAGLVSGKIPACVKEEERVPAWNFPPRPEG
jgi:basic membrane protein A